MAAFCDTQRWNLGTIVEIYVIYVAQLRLDVCETSCQNYLPGSYLADKEAAQYSNWRCFICFNSSPDIYGGPYCNDSGALKYTSVLDHC
jgi:hypothetical protein